AAVLFQMQPEFIALVVILHRTPEPAQGIAWEHDTLFHVTHGRIQPDAIWHDCQHCVSHLLSIAVEGGDDTVTFKASRHVQRIISEQPLSKCLDPFKLPRDVIDPDGKPYYHEGYHKADFVLHRSISTVSALTPP